MSGRACEFCEVRPAVAGRDVCAVCIAEARRARACWYVCADRGGVWPMMQGPYSEGSARAGALREAGGFVVGFEDADARRDFLQTWAAADRAGRRGIVAQLQPGCPCGCETFPDADSRCDACHGEAGRPADDADVCSRCGAWGCPGTCAQGRDEGEDCTGCPGGCLQCRELDMRDLRSDEDADAREAAEVVEAWQRGPF